MAIPYPAFLNGAPPHPRVTNPRHTSPFTRTKAGHLLLRGLLFFETAPAVAISMATNPPAPTNPHQTTPIPQSAPICAQVLLHGMNKNPKLKTDGPVPIETDRHPVGLKGRDFQSPGQAGERGEPAQAREPPPQFLKSPERAGYFQAGATPLLRIRPAPEP